jgi:hypothetical protein
MKGTVAVLIVILSMSCSPLDQETAYSLEEEPRWGNTKEAVVDKLQIIGVDDLDKPHYFFGYITDISLDKNDNIYVLDYLNNSANRYNPKGEYITSYGSGRGQGPGEFQQASDICVDSQGQVYIADNEQRRISVFRSSGEFIKSFTTEDIAPLGDMISYGSSRLLTGVSVRYYTSGAWTKGIYQIYSLPEGKLSGSTGNSWDVENSKTHIGGNGICINRKNGNLVISYALPYLIEIYSADLSLMKRFGRKNSSFNTYSKDLFGNILANGSSWGVTSLPDGKIVNLIRERIRQEGEEALIKHYLDVFDENGSYLITIDEDKFKIDETGSFRCPVSDSQGNLWMVFENPFPHVVKYRISFIDKSE